MKPSPDSTGRLKAFSGDNGRRRFGRYETLFRIAGGGMAEVYAARIVGEGGFEKVVALKRMLPTLAEDERFVSMFLDEGRVAANISSPNVVQTLDLGRADDDSLYLVMELVVGVPLGQLIRGVLKSGEYVDLDIAVEIIAQAATGLHDAHEATTPMGDPLQLIHRDISPQNILVDRAGRTRITDFGVARALQSHSQTQTGEVKGKMSYFAPEQAKGGDLTSRVDIFALGIVAWELITARRLFKSDNPLNILRKIMDEPIPTVHEFRTEIPPALGACIAKALERDPNDRHESARAFALALRSAITPARQSAVGEYVKLHGAAALAPLEEGLKRSLTSDPDDEATRVANRGEGSSSGVSTSAIVPRAGSLQSGSQHGSGSGTGESETGSRSLALNAADSAGLRPASPAPKRTGIILAMIGIVVAGVATGVFLGLRPSPSTTALESLPAVTTPEEPALATPPAEGAQGPVEEAPVDVEGPDPELTEAAERPEPRDVRPTTMRVNPRGGSRTGMTPATAVQEPAEPPRSEMVPTPMAAVTPMTTASPIEAAPTPMATATPEPDTSMGTEMSESSMGLLMQWGD